MEKTLSKFDLFTGGETKYKYPQLTVYYNKAFTRMAGILNYYNKESGITQKSKTDLESNFINGIVKGKKLPAENAYHDLGNYLWKSFQNARNKEGYILTDHDKKMTVAMLQKLFDIRNYHSHGYHDNAALIFTKDLKQFILQLHDRAKNAAIQEALPIDGYQLSFDRRGFFKNHEGQWYITIDGRIFFLSFFLTSGEMARLRQMTEGYKRTGAGEFKVKHFIYSYFTHREGATRKWLGLEDKIINQFDAVKQKEISNGRTAFKILSYLGDQPQIISDPDKIPIVSMDGEIATQPDQLLKVFKEQNFLTEYNITSLISDKPGKGFLLIESGNQLIEISLQTAKMLFLDFIRNRSHIELIRDKINEAVNDRAILIEKLAEKQIDNIEELTVILESFYKYRLRADDKTTILLSKIIDNIRKSGYEYNSQDIKNLRHLITDKENEKYVPVRLRYHSFFDKKSSKYRNKDMFLPFAVQFLHDLGNTGIEFGFKKISPDPEITGDKKLIYNTIKPDGYKFAMHDDHFLIRVKDHIFFVGNSVLRNILIVHFFGSEKGKDILQFFNALDIELTEVEAARGNNNSFPENLKIFTKKELPASLLNDKNEPFELLVEKGKKRIRNIIDQKINPILTGSIYLSKAEKNRQIMKSYLYWDWHYPQNSNFKFLRKDEYQKMSIYHYCLQRDKPHRNFDFLLKDFKERIPAEIDDKIKQSKNLDELLINISKALKNRLENWYKELGKSSKEFPARFKKEILKKISTPTGTGGVREKAIPFMLHPMLVLRYFYPNALKKPKFSLSWERIRKNGVPVGLNKELYCVDDLENSFLKFHPDYKTIQRNIIGKINKTITDDTILYKIFEEYLKESDPVLADILKTPVLAGKNLRQQELDLELFSSKLGGKKGGITIRMKFHQLDDFLLVESQETILATARYLQRRIASDTNNTDRQQLTSLDFSLILEEVSRIEMDILTWVKAILAFEINTLSQLSQSGLNKLIKINDGFERITTDKILTYLNISSNIRDKVIGEENGIRKWAFHAVIPLNWTYFEREKDEELCALINYLPRIKNNYDYEKKS